MENHDEKNVSAPPRPLKLSGLALAAIICAALTLITCGATFLPAVVCGILALSTGSDAQRERDRKTAVWSLIIPGLSVFAVVVSHIALIAVFALCAATQVHPIMSNMGEPWVETLSRTDTGYQNCTSFRTLAERNGGHYAVCDFQTLQTRLEEAGLPVLNSDSRYTVILTPFYRNTVCTTDRIPVMVTLVSRQEAVWMNGDSSFEHMKITASDDDEWVNFNFIEKLKKQKKLKRKASSELLETLNNMTAQMILYEDEPDGCSCEHENETSDE